MARGLPTLSLQPLEAPGCQVPGLEEERGKGSSLLTGSGYNERRPGDQKGSISSTKDLSYPRSYLRPLLGCTMLYLNASLPESHGLRTHLGIQVFGTPVWCRDEETGHLPPDRPVTDRPAGHRWVHFLTSWKLITSSANPDADSPSLIKMLPITE